MRESDFDYFRRRADYEREAARHAGHPDARKAHLDMAQRYEEISKAVAPARVVVSLRPSARAEPIGR